MIQIGISIAVVLSLGNLVVLLLLLKRFASIERDSVESNGQDELHFLREEVSRSEREVRSEVRGTQEATVNTLVVNISELSKTLTSQLEGVRTTFDERFQGLQQGNENKLNQIRQTVTEHLQTTSDTLVTIVGELGNTQKTATDTLVATIGELGEAQARHLQDVTRSTNDLTRSNEASIESVRKTVDERIQTLQANNENKLDQIRQTVTEHLQTTSDTLVATVGELGEGQTQRLQDVTKATNNLTQSSETSIENVRKTIDERIQNLQMSNENSLDQIRQTVTDHLQTTSDTLVTTIGELGEAQARQLANGTKAINDLTQTNEDRIDNVRKTVDERLQTLQESNESRLVVCQV